MSNKLPVPSALLALALVLPTTASAGRVVLAPLIVEGNVTAKQRVGLHQLLESELDFSPEVDGVVSLPAAPPSLTDRCLEHAKCLGTIATSNGGTDVITGKVVGQGDAISLDLVFYAGDQIVRRRQFDLASDPTSLANSMTPIMREMLTGNSPEAEAAAAPSSDDFSFEDEVGGFASGAAISVADDGVADLLAADNFEDLDRQAAEEQALLAAAQQESARIAAEQAAVVAAAAAAQAAAQEAARVAATQEAARIAAAQAAAAQEAARLEAARIAAEQEAARIAAQQEATRIAAEQEAARIAAQQRDDEQRRLAAAAAAATAAAAPLPATDEALAGMITFNGSVDDITVEEIDAMIQFGAPPASGTSSPASYTPPPPPPSSGSNNALDPLLAAEQAELDAMENGGIAQLDDDDNGRRKGRSGNTGNRGNTGNTNSGTSSTESVPRTTGAKVLQVTARGGYSRYYSFNFITAGGELAVPLIAGLHALAGVEAYSVNRVLPQDQQVVTGYYSKWDTIFPVNTGAMYKFNAGIAQPYVGADVIFVQYYKDAIGSDWAAGGRLRGGVDIMVVKNFGFNLNVAVGGWTGKNWSLIEAGLGQAGVLPQVSGGTVIAF